MIVKSKAMKAVLAKGPKEGYSLSHSVEIPKLIHSGDVLLAVESCGVCASDAKMYHANTDFYWNRENGRVMGGKGDDFPGVVPGHEFVGTVLECGPDAKCSQGLPLQPGDRIVPEQVLACRNCRACDGGDFHKCPSLQLYGQGTNGGMAEFVYLSERSVFHRISTDIPSNIAALVEPLSIGVHAVDVGMDAIERISSKYPNDEVIVAVGGCGTIGLGILLTLKHRFANSTNTPNIRILGIDNFKDKPYKQVAAEQVGADVCVDLSEVKNYEWDIYFESSGHPSGLAQGVNYMRPTGRLVHLGIWDGGKVPDFNWNVVSALKELEIHGSSLGGNQRDQVWQRTIQMLEEDEQVQKAAGRIVTHTIPLEDFREAHEIAGIAPLQEEAQSIKMVLVPSGLAKREMNENCSWPQQFTVAKKELPVVEVEEEKKEEEAPKIMEGKNGITHTVLIKVKEGTTSEEIARLEKGVLSYKDHIPGISHIEVGTTVFAAPPNPPPEYDIAIRIQFPTLEALKAFGPHAAHQQIKKEVVDPIVQDKVVLDWETGAAKC